MGILSRFKTSSIFWRNTFFSAPKRSHSYTTYYHIFYGLNKVQLKKPLYKLTSISPYLSSVLNPLLYSFVGQEFRRDAAQVRKSQKFNYGRNKAKFKKNKE